MCKEPNTANTTEMVPSAHSTDGLSVASQGCTPSPAGPSIASSEQFDKETGIRLERSSLKSLALIVGFALALIGTYVGALALTGTAVGAEVQSVQPLAKPCKTVPASKWNSLVRTERSIDGTSRKLRRSPVCVHIYKKLKRHVAKVKRANCYGQGVICWIKKAAAKYGQPLGDAIRVARCESTFNPGLVNSSSGASGLYQFLPSTWQTTPYRTRNIFNAKWNALAAMWMWSVGRRGEWVCQ